MKTLLCEHCNTHHDLFYVVTENEDFAHMAYRCPKRGMVMVPKVEGLNLPVVHSRRWHRKQQEERQQKLF